MIIDLAARCANMITVVTPVYEPNLGLFEKTVNSMFYQTVPDWRWVIVLDGARTIKKVKSASYYDKLCEDNRITIVEEQKHVGVSKARNLALDLINSGFVAFLDADNWFHSEAVNIFHQTAKQTTDQFEQGERLIFTYKQCVIIRPEHYENTPHYAVNFRDGALVTPYDLFFDNKTDLGQILHTVGDTRFDEEMTRLVDWDYLIQLFHSGYQQIAFTDIVTSFYDSLYRKNRVSCSESFPINRNYILNKWKDSIVEMDKKLREQEEEQCEHSLILKG